jgi:hypothetical protein
LPSFVAYIDESGDEGFGFGRGASDWFVLSAAVTRASRDIETVKLVDRVRSLLPARPPRKPLHFRDMRHEHRLPYVHEIRQAPLRLLSIAVHKPSIEEPEKFDERFRLYFYAVRLLLERVSWLCRDAHRPDDGDGCCSLVFSNRSGMSYQELRGYLEILRGRPEVRIHWPAIDVAAISAYSPGKRMGLQIADAVASGIYFGVQPRYGLVEARYAQMLMPVTYRHEHRVLGYGLKFWPPAGEGLTLARPEWAWFPR